MFETSYPKYRMALRQALVDPRRDAFHVWQAEPEPGYTFVTVRVNATDAVLARKNLHLCLGDLIEVYTVQDNHRMGCSTFQIKLRSCSIDFLMHQIMQHLPEAEFGQIVNASDNTRIH